MLLNMSKSNKNLNFNESSVLNNSALKGSVHLAEGAPIIANSKTSKVYRLTAQRMFPTLSKQNPNSSRESFDKSRSPSKSK